MNQRLVVGSDPHRKKNVMPLMEGQGQVWGPPRRVDTNRPGRSLFIQAVIEPMQRGGQERLEGVREASGWYWFQRLESRSQALLNQWPVELCLFKPGVTAQFKQSYSDQDKTDRLDGAVVADGWRFGRDLAVPFRPDATYLPLRCLTRYYFHITHNLAGEKAYSLVMGYLKASDYPHPDKQPFAKVLGAASQAVLQEFAAIDQIAALPFEELVEFIDLKGNRPFADPADNARKLHQVAHDAQPLPAALQPAITTILTLCGKHISVLEAQQKRLQTAIADQLASMPHPLATIPGIGPVFAAGLIAEIGPLDRFTFDQAKVAKFAGLMGGKSGSADFQAEETPIIHNCNRYWGYYFCEAANTVRLHDVAYATYYDRKFHEVPKHPHKRAVVLTARKLGRLVVRRLTTNQPYRPRRL